MKHTRYYILLFVIAFILSVCSGCANNESEIYSTDKELYEMGLELIDTLEEMVQSDSYREIITTYAFDGIINDVRSGDYNSPMAVYSVTIPNVNKVIEEHIGYHEDKWNDLSRKLQKQIKNKFSFNSLFSLINASGGVDTMAFSTAYTASDENEELNLNKNKMFLYIFDNGTPIAVTFSEHGTLQAQFLFIEDIESLSDIKEVFEQYECKIKRINIE